jgi:hypothetical protein
MVSGALEKAAIRAATGRTMESCSLQYLGVRSRAMDEKTEQWQAVPGIGRNPPSYTKKGQRWLSNGVGVVNELNDLESQVATLTQQLADAQAERDSWMAHALTPHTSANLSVKLAAAQAAVRPLIAGRYTVVWTNADKKVWFTTRVQNVADGAAAVLAVKLDAVGKVTVINVFEGWPAEADDYDDLEGLDDDDWDDDDALSPSPSTVTGTNGYVSEQSKETE